MEKNANPPSPTDAPAPKRTKRSAASQFFLRGLAISLPPVLTLVILIWIAQGMYGYVIRPASTTVQYVIALFIEDTRPVNELSALKDGPSLPYCGQKYVVTNELSASKQGGAPSISPEFLLEEVYVPFGDEAVPYKHYAAVAKRVGPNAMPSSVLGVYMQLVTIQYFGNLIGLSVAVILLTGTIIYFIGRIVTARLGAWTVNKVETLVLARLPVISNVYSSVKQVTDFLFTERTVEYNRVIALEYPRRGIWSLGFVTSDSMLDVTMAAGEPLLSVLMPTSPMPMTGFTVSVPRRDVVDLNITIDQAFQFCLSCGVLVPAQQMVTPELLQQQFAKQIAERMLPGGPAAAAHPASPDNEAENRHDQRPSQTPSLPRPSEDEESS